MALTVTLDMPRARRVSKASRHAFISGTIAFDSSYPTGGESCTDITKWFKTTNQVMCDSFGGYLFTFDKANSKIKAMAPVDVVAGSGTAAANNYVFKNTVLEVDGTGTAFQVPGAEVLDTTDLSGLTAVRFVAYGVF